MFNLSASRKIILSLVTLGVGIMLVTSFVSRMGNNELFVKNRSSNAMSQSKADALAAEIGQHMEELKKDPKNYSTLVHTADLLIQSEQWEAAESFLKRAIAIDNAKSEPYSLLAVALHNQEKNQEAVQALEKEVSMNNSPIARYNLTMLYIHFLDDQVKGKMHLLEALKSSELSEEVRTSLEDELKKLEEQKKNDAPSLEKSVTNQNVINETNPAAKETPLQ